MQLVAVGLIRRAPKRSRRGLGDVAHLDFRTVALDPNCGSRLLSEDCDTKIVCFKPQSERERLQKWLLHESGYSVCGK